jgi:hypothetical protein
VPFTLVVRDFGSVDELAGRNPDGRETTAAVNVSLAVVS